MKKLLTALVLAVSFSTPVFAAPDSIQVEVPVNPTTEQIVAAKEDILEASETVCSDAVSRAMGPRSYKKNLATCVELTYENAIETAVENDLAFLADETVSSN